MSNNGRYGITTQNVSDAVLLDTVISSNGSDGVAARFLSHISLGSGIAGAGNAGWGVYADWQSSVNVNNGDPMPKGALGTIKTVPAQFSLAE